MIDDIAGVNSSRARGLERLRHAAVRGSVLPDHTTRQIDMLAQSFDHPRLPRRVEIPSDALVAAVLAHLLAVGAISRVDPLRRQPRQFFREPWHLLQQVVLLH